ncbi:hypothetical protein [Streptomyces sp. NPDC051452]|uniref:hypothetical protein n=1 Tax=Streptomyces sp. NPDC051452 TaxID=3365654 RepID=UPI0037A1C194
MRRGRGFGGVPDGDGGEARGVLSGGDDCADDRLGCRTHDEVGLAQVNPEAA